MPLRLQHYHLPTRVLHHAATQRTLRSPLTQSPHSMRWLTYHTPGLRRLFRGLYPHGHSLAGLRSMYAPSGPTPITRAARKLPSASWSELQSVRSSLQSSLALPMLVHKHILLRLLPNLFYTPNTRMQPYPPIAHKTLLPMIVSDLNLSGSMKCALYVGHASGAGRKSSCGGCG